MPEWGRKQYSKAWPSRRPVWTIGAFFAATLALAGMLTIQYERSWTAAEGLYWKDYLKSGARGQTSARTVNRYTLLEGMTAKGQGLILKGDQVETVTDADGRQGWRLTEAGAKLGIAKLQWVTGTFNDRALHRLLGSVVYSDLEGWEFYRVPVWTAAALFVLLLFVAVPRDRKRRMVWKHGRRLRGPELVTTAELNERLGKSNLLTTTLPDGVAFINEEQTWIDKLIRKQESRWARIPRDREAMHFLIVGDSGTGKSAAIRQLLSQIWERGEAAIVYDPAMEYLPQFTTRPGGDVILNPMDARCPFWSPGDEVPHEAEALTLAASLFPDQGRENRFFVEAPSNGWDWDEKPHWPTPQPHPRQQSFGDCFNGAMKANALPGGSNTQNTLTATTTAATIWNLISPNPVAKTVGVVNAWYNLSRIVPAALVCSDPDAHF